MAGVWRTVRGRRVFISDGQSLAEAMEQSGKFDKWNYPGIEEMVSKLEEEVENVKTFNRAASIRVALDAQDRVVTKALEEVEKGLESGDEKRLMAYRRRIRVAKRKLIDKKVLG